MIAEKISSETDCLGNLSLPIEVIVGDLLKKKSLSLATAESCTGGNIAAKLTAVPGCSDYFKGSVVAYSNEVKISLLNVSGETLENKGAVSEETVIEMVKGAMKALNTNCAVATSGIAGPGGGTIEKPVGTVWIAAAYQDDIITLKQTVDKGRKLNIENACNNALLMLHKLIK
ncbi:CinA family protein [uncultured Bacteroides sp.]|uniref:CinA family protein n=1 Tax=uncultured Bacteroides sp. TaxID=162156 RepID=UPI002AA615E8|nr:CinA family protein [uncultured Bacteroides sp.]